MVAPSIDSSTPVKSLVSSHESNQTVPVTPMKESSNDANDTIIKVCVCLSVCLFISRLTGERWEGILEYLSSAHF